MRFKCIIVILWVLCILIATNNYNFQSLLFNREIGFNVRLFPDLFDFFIISDIYLNSKTYVFQKIGHAISFGILFILIDSIIRDAKKAIILSGTFALFTEVLQLFFERSGRFFDVLIDVTGIYLASRLMNYIKDIKGLKSILVKIKRVFANKD